MRVTIILVSLLFLSSAMYAQQARQMQKQGAVVQSQTPNSGVVVSTASAPRQMQPVNGKPVQVTGQQHTGTNAPANGGKREMTPLNPDKVVQKKN